MSLHTSAVRRLYTWQHERVRWKWFAVCWEMEPWLMPWPEWVPSLASLLCICLRPETAPRFYCMLFLFMFFILMILTNVHLHHTTATGGPDSPPHCLPFRENWHRPAVAAAYGSPRCRHHQRLHAPPHLSQGRPGWDRCCPTGGWSVALAGYKGKCLATCRGVKLWSVMKNAFSLKIQPHCYPVGRTCFLFSPFVERIHSIACSSQIWKHRCSTTSPSAQSCPRWCWQGEAVQSWFNDSIWFRNILLLSCYWVIGIARNIYLLHFFMLVAMANSSEKVNETQQSRNNYCNYPNVIISRMASPHCTWQLIMTTKMWRSCCWKKEPRLMPLQRLCTEFNIRYNTCCSPFHCKWSGVLDLFPSIGGENLDLK